MTSEHTTDGTDRGQTYGEACDEVIAKAALTIASLQEEAAEQRALGYVDEAEQLEAEAEAVAEPVVELIEKRRSMPFGNLTDEQRESFCGLFGIDPGSIDTATNHDNSATTGDK